MADHGFTKSKNRPDIAGNSVAHSLYFKYDMLSQLTDAGISNINGGNWVAEYTYHDNGDMSSRTIQSSQTDFTYTGNLMDTASGGESFDLDWDENGQLTAGASSESLVYNWDGKLRHAEKGTATIDLNYDPMGNRIRKESNISGTKKYIVDIVGDLPVILLELDSSNNIKKTYIYANSQIIAQHNGSHTASRYFYLHDRLGSVRQLIDTNGDVVKYYTFEPFGQTLESGGTFNNSFMFTGQFFDSEIDEYYLRARQYDPYIHRFTSRDPVKGKFKEPMTLHVYLYCLNDPVNHIDPTGEMLGLLWGQSLMGKMRTKIAGVGAAAKVGATRFVDTIIMVCQVKLVQASWTIQPGQSLTSRPEQNFAHMEVTKYVEPKGWQIIDHNESEGIEPRNAWYCTG